MLKPFHMLWATVLSACVPSYVTKDGCVVSQEEQTFWEATVKKGTTKAYKTYLTHYPQGCYVARAAAKLTKPVAPPVLKKITPPVQPVIDVVGIYN